MNYYNEYDRKTAAWLRELIRAGAIPDGHVDERSIADVHPPDLRDYTQCHFFAGIGGWSYALQLAGWPSDRPVWTGSCPCQPFSTAGKGLAQSDERHLWPVFFNLIRQCRPDTVFGEQVASAIGHGWLDGVSSDLEAEDYTCGATVLGAHSVNSPHQRQRLYWVANSDNPRPQGWSVGRDGSGERLAGAGGVASGLADAYIDGRDQAGVRIAASGRDGVERNSAASGLAGADQQQQHGIGNAGPRGRGEFADGCGAGWPRPTNGHWRDADWLFCRDGKWRPVEPGTFPLAHGVSGRVGLLRGYGNAIVPQVASEFVAAFMDVMENTSAST